MSNDQGSYGDSSRTGRPNVSPPQRQDEKVAAETRYEDEGRIDEVMLTIVETVAEATDKDPSQIVPGLSDAIDPDALENLFRTLPDGTERSGWVSFFFQGCRVVVTSERLIRIYVPDGD